MTWLLLVAQAVKWAVENSQNVEQIIGLIWNKTGGDPSTFTVEMFDEIKASQLLAPAALEDLRAEDLEDLDEE